MKSTSATVATAAAISPEALGSADQAEIRTAVAIGGTAAEDDEHHRLVVATIETDNLADAPVRDANVVQPSEVSWALRDYFESPHGGATARAPEKVLPVLEFPHLSQVFARLGSIS
jgi:hypothetical protein